MQNSVMVPYNMLIWLKKSTVFTATHLKVSVCGERVTGVEISFCNQFLLIDVLSLRKHHSQPQITLKYENWFKINKEEENAELIHITEWSFWKPDPKDSAACYTNTNTQILIHET